MSAMYNNCDLLPRLSTQAILSPNHSFANRHTSEFITPQEVNLLEEWAGKAVCEALAGIPLGAEVSPR